jgi:hypothetical protein
MKTVMNTSETSASSVEQGYRCWLWAVGSSIVGTLVVWGVARLGDVDLSVQTGDDTRAVSWVSVLIASALAATAGMALLRFLQRRFGPQRARTIWTAVAVVVLLLSILAGPLNAVTVPGMISLSAMHLTVLVALAGTAWRR